MPPHQIDGAVMVPEPGSVPVDHVVPSIGRQTDVTAVGPLSEDGSSVVDDAGAAVVDPLALRPVVEAGVVCPDPVHDTTESRASTAAADLCLVDMAEP